MTTTTQQEHPLRAAVRTFVQVWIPGMLTALVVIPAVAQAILDEFGEALPDRFRLILVGVVTGAAAVSAVLARIMAIPAVDRLVERVRLGSAPASTLEG